MTFSNIFMGANYISIFVFILLIILSLFISEFIDKKDKNHEEITRKTAHILIGILFTLSPLFVEKTEIIISSIIIFFGVWIAKYSPFFKKLFRISRMTMGMWMSALSLGIMAWLWLPENIIPFMVGMLVLTFSDALAAVFGRIYGKIRIPYSSKTIFGSTAFFLSTIIILFIFSKENNVIDILWISLSLTVAEIVLSFGLDNLFIPILSSYLFYLFLG